MNSCTMMMAAARLSSTPKSLLLSTLLSKKSLSTSSVKSSSLYDKYLGPQSVQVSENSKVNRWSMFVPAFGTHLCLGAPYGWSAISAALSREIGFVAPAAADWTLELASYPMSMMIAAGGLSSALVGKWTMRVGTRMAMTTGGTIYGLGFVLTAMGVAQHNLTMLYAGNLMCGAGYGCAYTPPIQALLDWFPDRKGLASGIVIAGFGSGALFFSPMMNALMAKYSKLPTYLGSDINTVTEGGKMFAKMGDGTMAEVVYATAADLAKLSHSGLAEGFYLAGSGSTGVAAGLSTMALIYGATVLTSAFVIRRPRPGYVPEGYVVPQTSSGAVVNSNVETSTVMKTPQFYLLFTTATLLATGGMGLMSVAKPMIGEVFTSSMPAVVTVSFASTYLLAMAGGNLAGRLGWAAVSDKIGRRNTFHVFTLGAVPIFATLPFLIQQVVNNPEGPMATTYLALFCVSTVGAISIMGGTFAVLPAYEADLFGPKYVQAIHGRFLVSATISTIVGPTLLLNLRKMSESAAIQDLLSKVDSSAFERHFGAGLSESNALIEAKTLTISKLMHIMPPGTVDPSPFIYNNTMYSMAGLVSVAAVMHFLIRPVDPKFFEKTDDAPKAEKDKSN